MQTTSGLSILIDGVISLPVATSCDNFKIWNVPDRIVSTLDAS